MKTAQTLSELVAIDSVSARSNAGIAHYLAGRCEALGLAVKRFPYSDDNNLEKFNLIALAGADFTNKPKVELALVGHMDTVPYDPAWSEATTLIENDGKLYARGACDTKGFIAAALSAVASTDLQTLRRPLALVFTGDEEVGLLGAKRLAAARPLEARFSIVGEPTSLQPIRAGKGYCLAEIVVHGREGHSAYPALGSSAIFRAARLIARIEKVATELEGEQHHDFDPPFTTLNVGLVRGGSAKNVIPGECRFTIEWRPIPGQGSERLLESIEGAVAEELKLDNDFSCEINASRTDSGFENDPQSELVHLMERLSGKKAGTVAFGTEAAQMMELGAEAVVFGPGNIRVAHRTGEFVPISELESCVTILAQAIAECCCRP
ncbi:MAG: acetylornithine deacetylase [Pyrinomonadaceae bacterium]